MDKGSEAPAPFSLQRPGRLPSTWGLHLPLVGRVKPRDCFGPLQTEFALAMTAGSPTLGREAARGLDQLTDHGEDGLLLPGFLEGPVFGEGVVGLWKRELVRDDVGQEFAQ